MNFTKLKNMINSLSVFSGGIVAHHLGGKILDYKADKEESLAQQERDEILNNVDKTVKTLAEKLNGKVILLENTNANTKEEDLTKIADKVIEGRKSLEEVSAILREKNISKEIIEKAKIKSV